MKFKEVKNCLRMYPKIEGMVFSLGAQIEQCRFNQENGYDAISVPMLTGLPRGGRSADPTFRKVDRAMNWYGERIEALMDRVRDLQYTYDAVGGALKLLHEKEMEVVGLRYFECLPWDELALRMSYSRTQCFRFHESAICKVKAYLESLDGGAPGPEAGEAAAEASAGGTAGGGAGDGGAGEADDGGDGGDGGGGGG